MLKSSLGGVYSDVTITLNVVRKYNITIGNLNGVTKSAINVSSDYIVETRNAILFFDYTDEYKDSEKDPNITVTGASLVETKKYEGGFAITIEKPTADVTVSVEMP